MVRFSLGSGQSPGPFFVYFRLFNLTQLCIYKSLYGMLGTRTLDGRMEGANESTVLWRHPKLFELTRT